MINFIIRNKTSNKKTFNKYKEKFYSDCQSFADATSININVYIDVLDKIPLAHRKAIYSPDGRIYFYRSNYYIQIPITHFKDYVHSDVSFNVCHSLYHELVHMVTAHRTAQNNLNYQPFKKTYRTQRDYIINIGFNFWTEFMARFKTNLAFKKYYKENFPLLRLVKELKNLKAMYKTLIIPPSNDNDLDKIIDFENLLSDFLYDCSVFLALYKNNYYTYCEKTQNDTEFIEVENFLSDISSIINKTFHGMYGKRHIKRLWKMGCCILDEIYSIFNMDISRKNNKYGLAFYYN